MFSSKFYYGWYIVLTLAITETISWGIIHYAFSVFIAPMEADLGWSRTHITGGFSLSLLVMGGMAFPVGWWVDRHGARGLMTCGSILAMFLVIGWSQVSTLTGFYLIWIGLGVCAAATLYDPAFIVIATWFEQHRSNALAVVTFAGGLASTIFLPLSDALLGAFGWRTAVLILGILLGITTIPLHALILRRHPNDLKLNIDGKTHQTLRTDSSMSISLSKALRTRFFWWLTLAFGLSYLSTAAIRVHFIPFLIDTGIDASTAAWASGSIGFMQVAGRVIFAPLDNRFPSQVMVIGIFALQALAMFILIFDTSLVAVIAFIMIFGAAYGARTLARPSILATAYGTAFYGRISSVMIIFLTLATTVAPIGAAWLYDRFGNYSNTLWIVAFLAVGATTIMLLMTPVSTKPTLSLTTPPPSPDR